jgi:hypothetical protein
LVFFMRGQGATEYLVLLAAVLIIALVSLALLGFFPGMASDAKISQSSSYWRSEAKPFSINEHSLQSGNLTLIIQLKDATGEFTLTNISVDNVTNSTIPAGGKDFNAGETKTIIVYGVGTDKEAGDVYEFPVNLTYTSPNGISTMQYGQKALIGKASG